MKLHPLVSALRSEFEAHADAETAEGMEKYMRDQFRFLGIKKPLRARLLLPYVKEFRALPEEEWPQVAKQIWDLPRREYQYAAMELCAKKLKSYLPGHLELFEYMIQDRSWWDTVDFIAGNLVGGLFRMHPQLIGPAVMRWTAGPDFWFHRCSILFQLKYGKKTDARLLFRLCRDFAGEKEFFIRKAIGWALRQYSKSEPAAVRDFIGRQKLSPLSRKEASKYI